MAVSITVATAVEAADTNQPALQVRGFPEQVTSQWEIQRGLLTYGTNQITFVLPAEYTMKADVGALRIAMEFAGDVRQHGFSVLKLQIYPLADYPTNAPNDKWLREKCQKDHPDAILLGEFTGSIGAYSGPGIEMRKPSGQNSFAIVRQVVIALPDCVVEVAQTASAEHIDFHQASFNQIMLSFRCSPVGSKVEFRPLVLE